MGETLGADVARRLEELVAIGRDGDTAGCRRLAWSREDVEARRWFTEEAERLGLEVERDRNANLWAWWSPPGSSGGAVAVGSHLDTVADGGAFDGALGVVAGLSALDDLRRQGIQPGRPLAVVVFADGEGARFETPCFGSALLTGEIEPAAVVDRRDQEGNRLGDALAAAGVDPEGLGEEPGRLEGLAAFLELHVEQGRRLVEDDAALGVVTGVWPHGRWRLTVTGESNHAGTTPLDERRDPAQVVGRAVTAAREHASVRGALATVGKVLLQPNDTTVIPSRGDAWLEARAPDGAALDRFLDEWAAAVGEAADTHGCDYAITSAAFNRPVTFDEDVQRRLERRARDHGQAVVSLVTPAGHDAAMLAEHVPAGLLSVRNPTGVSHAPAEHAAEDDCLAGVRVLASVLTDLAG